MKTTYQKLELAAEKFFDLPFIVHFFFFWLTLFLIIPPVVQYEMGWPHAIKFGLLISLVISLGISSLLGVGKISTRFYEELRIYEQEFENAGTRDEIIQIRAAVIDFHSKKAVHRNMSQEVKRLITKIDTTLKYKYPQET